MFVLCSSQREVRALTDKVDLATLTLDVTVRDAYAPLVARSFGDQAARVWSASLSSIAMTGRLAALAAIWIVPWAAMLAVAVGAVLAVGRWVWLRRRK